ncbi:MAG: NAD(P)-dependent oxidoreductase [Solirubrobacteraceae bacterium]
MKVLVAGATGVIGRRLLPLLIAAGHEVTGMTRTPAKVEQLLAAGAKPVVADALNKQSIEQALEATQPDAVIHELTALPRRFDPKRIVQDLELNDRVRSQGTRLLVDAAQAVGARRIVAQSIAFAYAPGPAGSLRNEQDPILGEQAPKVFRRTALALGDLERAVLGADGIVLRYGYFYGPDSTISSNGSVVEDIVKRRIPIVGKGTGVWSFVHVDDAARATVRALGHDGPAVYNIVDDEPAPASEWIPLLASAVSAPRPFKVPVALARMIAGSYGVRMMTRSQGASNALAKRELGWQPEHTSWRQGFRTALD